MFRCESSLQLGNSLRSIYNSCNESLNEFRRQNGSMGPGQSNNFKVLQELTGCISVR